MSPPADRRPRPRTRRRGRRRRRRRAGSSPAPPTARSSGCAPTARRIDRVGDTGGRPLGLELLPDGRLLVCDARRGLLALDPRTGAIEELADARARPADGVLQQRRGAQRRRHLVLRLLHASTASTGGRPTSSRTPAPDGCCAGRRTARSRWCSTGSRFANGVALAADESYVAVAETAGRTVVRRWLTGADGPGSATCSPTDLPGYPDNIARGSDGLVWVTIASPTRPGAGAAACTAPRCRVRRLAWRLPDRLQPKPKRTVAGAGLRRRRRRGARPAADASAYHLVTGVREHEGRVWLGSLEEPAVAVLRRPRRADVPDRIVRTDSGNLSVRTTNGHGGYRRWSPGSEGEDSMDNALDVELHDEELVDEIRLVTELMVVAAMAPGDLEQDVIDDALGVDPTRAVFPGSARPTGLRTPRRCLDWVG